MPQVSRGGEVENITGGQIHASGLTMTASNIPFLDSLGILINCTMS